MPPPRTFTALFLATLACGAVAAQDPKPPANPEYASWAKLKKGAAITLTHTVTVGNQTPTTSLFTHRLVEVKDDKDDKNDKNDKVVLETTQDSNVGGKVVKGKPYKTEIGKTFTPARWAGKEGVALFKPEGTVSEDDVTIKIGKTEYKTTRYCAQQKDAFGEPLEVKVWLSPDVPGCLVKKEIKNVGTRPSLVVIEFGGAKKP